MSGEQKLKDGDEIIQELEFTNNCDLLFFTDKCQVYKAKADDFAQTKASVLGDYVAAKLGFDEGENAVKMVVTKDYKGMLLFAFENGKAATQGVAVLKPKKGHRLFSIERYKDGTFTNPKRYRTGSLPARGALPVNDDSKDEQLSLI